MKLRTVLTGSGTEEDPYRSPLPTWTMIDIDYQQGWVLVEVPEYVYPEAKGWTEVEVTDTRGKVHKVAVPRRETVAVWEEVEAEKYPQFAKDRQLRDILLGR